MLTSDEREAVMANLGAAMNHVQSYVMVDVGQLVTVLRGAIEILQRSLPSPDVAGLDEVTGEMIAAGQLAFTDVTEKPLARWLLVRIYKAMLAALPQPPGAK